MTTDHRYAWHPRAEPITVFLREHGHLGKDRSAPERAGDKGMRESEPGHFHDRTLLSAYRSITAESILQQQAFRLAKDAQQAGVSQRSLSVQAMLHLPAPYVPAWTRPEAAYEAIRPVILSRASAMEEARRDVLSQADRFGIRREMKIKNHSVHIGDDRIIPLEVRTVAPSMGQYFQSRLHYLLSPRADNYFEAGLFQDGATWPLLYLGFSTCDRPDLLSAINYSNHRQGFPLVLSRTVGVSDLPANAFSYTLRRALRLIRDGDYPVSHLITAINPFVGFTGTSVVAAGLRPVASRRVRYRYDTRGHFTAARLASTDSVSCRRRVPPNMILARFFDHPNRNEIEFKRLHQDPVDVRGRSRGRIREQALPDDLRSWLRQARTVLESGWSGSTLHPDFVGATHRNPARGQCGVSSVWIMRQLKSVFSVDARYCYGDLSFRDPEISEVRRHCWLEISSDRRSKDATIIDITVDQADGFGERILVGKRSELISQGIFYRARITKTLEELPRDAVWSRYLVLADSVHRTETAA